MLAIELSPRNHDWLKIQLLAATANASVSTAKSGPRTRSAGAPTRRDAAAAADRGVDDGRRRTASPGRRGRRSSSPRGRRTRTGPSDSCPAQPVRTVTDSATRAKISMRENRKVCDDAEATTGSSTPKRDGDARAVARRPLLVPVPVPAPVGPGGQRRTSCRCRRRRGGCRAKHQQRRRRRAAPRRSRPGSATLVSSIASTTPMAMPPASDQRERLEPADQHGDERPQQEPGPERQRGQAGERSPGAG